MSAALGTPHLHLRATTSTNDRARELAVAGAPHGTLVTAGAQSAGRGRQGRAWTAPPGRALLMSLVLRVNRPAPLPVFGHGDGRLPPPGPTGSAGLALLPLAAGVAVADACGPDARVKWPNDVQLGGRKVAGILTEGRPQEGWAVLGIGLNVALRADDLPAELRDRATGLGLTPEDVPRVLARVLAALDAALALPPTALLARWRERDALLGRRVAWAGGEGAAAGIDDEGRLRVALDAGGEIVLDAGEVHLAPA